MEFKESNDNFAFQVFQNAQLQQINLICCLQERFQLLHRSSRSLSHDSLKERELVPNAVSLSLLHIPATVAALDINAPVSVVHSAHDEVILELIFRSMYLVSCVFSLLFENLRNLKENQKPLQSGCSFDNFYTSFSCYGPFLNIFVPFGIIHFLFPLNFIIQTFFSVSSLDTTKYVLL